MSILLTTNIKHPGYVDLTKQEDVLKYRDKYETYHKQSHLHYHK